MTGPLVETKLFVPAPRRDIVVRPRLRERLEAHARLTLLSAPAGFGKTTLLASAERRRPTAPATSPTCSAARSPSPTS